MTPVLGTLLGGVLDKVIDKLTNQLPVTENEKENIRVQAEKELASHAGAIAEAEVALSNNAKDTWLAELHNGGFLATSWRPLAAVTSLALIVWDGVLLPVFNAALRGLDWSTIAAPPTHVAEVSMWVLLTLIGARGVEKIAVVSKRGK